MDEGGEDLDTKVWETALLRITEDELRVKRKLDHLEHNLRDLGVEKHDWCVVGDIFVFAEAEQMDLEEAAYK